MKKIQSIHFVGIKGVGMTPLAVIAKEAGLVVTGSDVAEIYITSEVLKKVGITPIVGFDKEHVGQVDLVIITGAHGGFDNVEVQAAKEKNIPIWTQGQAVGEYMKGDLFGKANVGISVAGCHGKTTTTAMIATILQGSGKDPSWVIGTGDIPSLGSSGHFGKGAYFIAEADEYAAEPHYDKTPKFLLQHPKIAVLTNIEYDHPDLYPTFEDLIKAYEQFAKQVVQEEGTLIVNGDDTHLRKIAHMYPKSVITFGKSKENDYILASVLEKEMKTVFVVLSHGESISYTISVIGMHNVMNALASIIASKASGLTDTEIQYALPAFTGSKRRLEYIGTTSESAKIYDDYAHHPTEIKASLEALRKHFPDAHILCAFQPHTFSRTKILFNEFIESFSQANEVVLADIFPSAREPLDTSISSRYLSDAIEKMGKVAHYLPKLSDVVAYLKEKRLDKNSIIVTMGAGDIYQVAYEIKK